MKVYIKRNQFHYKGENYSNDVLLNVKETCNCMKNIDYEISTSTDKDYDTNHAKIQIYLLKRHIETDVDYDWDENPIEQSYEEEEFIPINYCPICGDKIEIIIEKLVDKTAMIKPLMNKIIELELEKYSIKNAKEKYKIANKINQIMSQ